MNMQLFARLVKYDETTGVFKAIAADETVDATNEICDYESTKPHVLEWSGNAEKNTGGKSVGNLRAMHDSKKVVGKLTSLVCDDSQKAFVVEGKIIDPVEKLKFAEGCYSGVSIGGKYGKTWPDPDKPGVTRYTAIPHELSLADVPCNPNARFTVTKTLGEGDTAKEVSEERPFVGLARNIVLDQKWMCAIAGHEHESKAAAAKCIGEVTEKLLKGEKVDNVRESFAKSLGVELVKTHDGPHDPHVQEHEVEGADGAKTKVYAAGVKHKGTGKATELTHHSSAEDAHAKAKEHAHVANKLFANKTVSDTELAEGLKVDLAVLKAALTPKLAPAPAPASALAATEGGTVFKFPPEYTPQARNALTSPVAGIPAEMVEKASKLSKEQFAVFEEAIKTAKTVADVDAALKKAQEWKKEEETPIGKLKKTLVLDTPSAIRGSFALLSSKAFAKKAGITEEDREQLLGKVKEAWVTKIGPMPTVVAEDKGLPAVFVRKSLYTVASLAQSLSQLHAVLEDYEYEQEREGDDSEACALLEEARDALAHALAAVAQEETQELLEDAEVKEAVNNVINLTKASIERRSVYMPPESWTEAMRKEANAKIKAAEPKDRDTVAKALGFVLVPMNKRGARHSKDDMQRLQKIHDHSVDMGAACYKEDDDTTKTFVGDLRKMVGAEGKTLADTLSMVKTLQTTIKEQTTEIEKLKKEPAAPKGAVLDVSKAGDINPVRQAQGAADASKSVVKKADGTVDQEATAKNLIKQAHAEQSGWAHGQV